MSKDNKIRWGWLKFMYLYAVLGAGSHGLGIIFAPRAMQVIYDLPPQDPITFGIVGSVFLAFALLSILGLRSPLKFVPVLLLQLLYKSLWFIVVALPHSLTGKFPTYIALVFATYIIGDLIAIPFSHVFAKN
jgi:hypothetical protein